MKHIFEFLKKELLSGKNAELVTIAGSVGPSPRKSGVMMVCCENEVFGTIGGGELEYRCRALALQALLNRRSFLQSFDLTDSGDLGMICGGKDTVLFQYFDSQDTHALDQLDKITDIQANGKRGWMIAGISEAGMSFSICRSLSEILSEFPALSGADVRNLAKAECIFSKIGENNYFVQPLSVPATVYLFGAGHISFCLAPLLSALDFNTVVYDDRSEFANAGRFPLASGIIVAGFEQFLDHVTIEPQDYVVIMTRGHRHDYAVISRVLRCRPFYLGMIGSSEKAARTFRALQEKDGYAKNDIDRIKAPIGLSIGSETPEEIAVSIAAQLIKERYEGNQEKRPG